MFAITDHNRFDFELYECLKKKILNNKIVTKYPQVYDQKLVFAFKFEGAL